MCVWVWRPEVDVGVFLDHNPPDFLPFELIHFCTYDTYCTSLWGTNTPIYIMWCTNQGNVSFFSTRIFKIPLFPFLRQVFLKFLSLKWYLSLIGWTGCQWVLGTHHCWSYGHILLHPASTWVLGTCTVVSALARQALYRLSHPAGPRSRLF